MQPRIQGGAGLAFGREGRTAQRSAERLSSAEVQYTSPSPARNAWPLALRASSAVSPAESGGTPSVG